VKLYDKMKKIGVMFMTIKKTKIDLKRPDLKNNFLKQIIIRFDYTGVTEVELEAYIGDIKLLLKKYGYDRMVPEMTTEMDFQVEDPETVEEFGLAVSDIRRMKVYVFTNKDSGIKLKISQLFAFISIEKAKYKDFFEYSKALIDVVALTNEKIPLFTGERFGLRKINICCIKDMGVINNYFEPILYTVYSYGDDSRTKLFNAKNCIAVNDYNINLTRNVLAGEYDGLPVYQVVLDSDIYLRGDKVMEVIQDIYKVKEMNDILFDLYKSAITEGFLSSLQDEEFIDDNIMGVEKNE
jgi:uncharacterized protein (TIGR04255 family)